MATEYKLSYTATEIDEKLGKIDSLVATVNGVSPDENGNVVVSVSGGNADQGGLTAEQISALDGMFKICAYTADATNAYKAFQTAFGIGGEVEPDEPDVPVEPDEPDAEKTLTSISATYNGGAVTAGTAVSALTGIVVTAHYSDGTSEAVTGYTLSGTIAEGSNTITVSYGGKTTTFTVTGVAESGETNDTTAKIAEYGYALKNGNATIENSKMCYTELYDISNVFDGVTASYGYIKGSFKYSDVEIAASASCAHLYVDNAYADYKNATSLFSTDGTEGDIGFKADDYSGKTLHLKVTLQTAHIDDSYLYMAGSGRVVFAGKNTPYYNMANIDGTPYVP
jgi:hypothetical protein